MSTTIILTLAAIFSCHVINAELYTALTDLEELLDTESVLIENLDGFIEETERKLIVLRAYSKLYHTEHQKASENVAEYLANPINAYLLVKRLTVDWGQVETIMSENVGEIFIDKLTNYRDVLKFPGDEDLNGAAVALVRLQETYDLNPNNLAHGRLNGTVSTTMTASDCFEIGRQLYYNGDFFHTLQWMQEASYMLKDSSNDDRNLSGITQADILEYLAFSFYKQGNVQRALKLTEELLEIVPNHERALGNVKYYKDALEVKGSLKVKGDVENLPLADQSIILDAPRPKYSAPLYEALCRGEDHLSPAIRAQLHCRYAAKSHPFTILAPFKEEDAYLEPRVVLFHDVMSEREIALIKNLAQPRLNRATVQNHKTGKLEFAHYRISKSAWLREEEHDVVRKVCERVSHMTGLRVDTAEELQVVNYGIGGHYEPHFDFARKDEQFAFRALGTGNRVATVLFYMSDVSQGGATVFPYLKVAVWPRKGQAAFWFNLHESGEGDYMTRHAACPVLSGTKWVANKWIHERGQEFVRPCGLERGVVEPEFDEFFAKYD